MWPMRVRWTLILLGMSQVGGPAQASGVQVTSQSLAFERPALERPAELRVEEVPILQALADLNHRTGGLLAFSADLLPGGDVLVTCACGSMTVGGALDELLKETGLRYTLVNDHVVIIPGPTAISEPPSASVRSGLRFVKTTVEPRRVRRQGTVTGVVTDARSARPMTAVQVSLGAGLGALTNETGRFAIANVPAGDYTITVQRIGYRTISQEVTVRSGATVQADFAMEQEALALAEIIVTGTPGGTQRRAIGNVVERMDVAALTEVAPVTTVEQMLGSRLPGMTSASTGGSLGSDGALIRIRGSSSSALSGEPIIYVDGIRINTIGATGRDGSASRLNDINPADIESVEVIKGPAAATLYGTEAANGVIQIITKRGISGPAVFQASLGLGARWLPNPQETIPVKYGTSPTTGELISIQMPIAEEERFGTPFFQYGPTRIFGLSVRGGTDQLRYFSSVNRSYEEGVVDWNWEKNQSARLSLTFLPRDELDITLNASYMTSTTREPGGYFQSMLRGNVETAGDYGGADSRLRGWDQVPESFRNGREEMEDVDRMSVSAEVAYSPWEWFRSRLIVGTERTDESRHTTTFREENAPDGDWGFTGLGARSIANRETKLNTVDLAGTATFALNPVVGSSTSAGFQYNKKEFWTVRASGSQFATRVLATVSSGADRSGDEDLLENATVGVYVQQQFDWDQRIFLTGAVRADDNSAFGSEFEIATYPKVSATWVVDEESFWPLEFLKPFRVRGAWGMAGQQPDVFAAARLYSPATGPGDLPILTPTSFGNPALGPERGEELEVGFDAGLFNGRAELNFTQYWRTTKNAIVARTISPSEGYPGLQFVNLGQISAWGSEVGLDLNLLARDAVRWQMGVAFGTMNNRIDDQGDIDRIPVGRGAQHIEGYPLAGVHNIRVVSAEFVSGNSGPVTNVMCDGGTGRNGKEFGGAPVPCDEAPRLYWGPSEPTWSLNVNTMFTLFRDWRLFATVDARGGNIFHNDGIASRHDNWINTIHSNLRNDPIHMGYRAVDRTPLGFSKGGFGSLREVGINYALPTGLAERIGARNGSINIAARNLSYLWWSKNTMIAPTQRQSPETVSVQSGGGATGPTVFAGEGHSGFPQTAHLLVSVKVSF